MTHFSRLRLYDGSMQIHVALFVLDLPVPSEYRAVDAGCVSCKLGIIMFGLLLDDVVVSLSLSL